jgi:hypothetical protein
MSGFFSTLPGANKIKPRPVVLRTNMVSKPITTPARPVPALTSKKADPIASRPVLAELSDNELVRKTTKVPPKISLAERNRLETEARRDRAFREVERQNAARAEARRGSPAHDETPDEASSRRRREYLEARRQMELNRGRTVGDIANETAERNLAKFLHNAQLRARKDQRGMKKGKLPKTHP